jgi:hypothetical protein
MAKNKAEPAVEVQSSVGGSPGNLPDGHFAQMLPAYRCHKVVRAAKITDVSPADEKGAVLLDLGELGFSLTAGKEFVAKHNPKAGGYLVVYQDGYRSYSPAEAFESGYTKIPDAGVIPG